MLKHYCHKIQMQKRHRKKEIKINRYVKGKEKNNIVAIKNERKRRKQNIKTVQQNTI